MDLVIRWSELYLYAFDYYKLVNNTNQLLAAVAYIYLYEQNLVVEVSAIFSFNNQYN